MKIALAAGELSGDALGADLILSLKKIYPDASFIGIAGPRMQAQGCQSLFSMDTLSVMGVAEVIPRLLPILKMRQQLIQTLLENPPDVFIGIDSPDFMLPVEKALKKKGILTVHYVSPTVWAWREKRVLGIKASTDLMLCVFPFETAIYEKYGARALFIGHPAAERLSRYAFSKDEETQDPHSTVIALMPGSRSMEVKHLAKTFFGVAQGLWAKYPFTTFILPAVKESFKKELIEYYRLMKCSFPLEITVGNSRECMEKADVILCASGTTTLEAMFLNKPMVVAYKMSALNWWLAKLLVKVKFIALPNLLADQPIVSEWVQDEATVDNLATAVEAWINTPDRENICRKLYQPYIDQLTKNASEQAAQAIKELIHEKRTDHRR